MVEKEYRLTFWAYGYVTEHPAWPMSGFHDVYIVVANAHRRCTPMAEDIWERLATAVDVPKIGLFSTTPFEAKGLTKIRVRRALECRNQRHFETTVGSSDYA